LEKRLLNSILALLYVGLPGNTILPVKRVPVFLRLCANESTIPRYGVSCVVAYSYVGTLDLATAFALGDESLTALGRSGAFKSIENTGC